MNRSAADKDKQRYHSTGLTSMASSSMLLAPSSPWSSSPQSSITVSASASHVRQSCNRSTCSFSLPQRETPNCVSCGGTAYTQQHSIHEKINLLCVRQSGLRRRYITIARSSYMLYERTLHGSIEHKK